MVSMSSQVINSEPGEVVIGTDGQTIDAALSQTLPMIPDDDIGGGLLIADRRLHSIENCYIQSKGTDHCGPKAALVRASGRCVVPQGIRAWRHTGVEARFQGPELPQGAKDMPAALLDHCRTVGLGGWRALDNTRPQALGRAVYLDAFQAHHMERQIQLECAAETLETCHRPWLAVGSRPASCDGFVHIILPDRGAPDRLDLRGEVL
jgi:hypothetical protein